MQQFLDVPSRLLGGNVCCGSPRSKGNSLLPVLLLRLGRVGVVCWCSCCCAGGWVPFEVGTTSGESCAGCDTRRGCDGRSPLVRCGDVGNGSSRGGISRQLRALRGRFPGRPMKYTQIVEGCNTRNSESITETSQLAYSVCVCRQLLAFCLMSRPPRSVLTITPSLMRC